MNSGMKEIGIYGEALMERYLEDSGLAFEREPKLQQTTRRIDYSVQSSDGTRVLIEVKTLGTLSPIPPGSVGAYDPYSPLREHINDAKNQFSKLPDTINIIAFAAFPSSFVDIYTPRIVLGAMYGNVAFSIPFNTVTGQGDREKMSQVFQPGSGEMIRRQGTGVVARNTRISALLTLHSSSKAFFPDVPEGGDLSWAECARQAVAHVRDPSLPASYVTLWENAGANLRVPNELFTGPMDKRWGVQHEHQTETFIGTDRAIRDSRQRE